MLTFGLSEISGLLSIADLTKEEIEFLIASARRLKNNGRSDLLQGMILASCFFEPSTRTRLSFESAMLRAGGAVIGFSEPSGTSAQKGESLSDAIRMIGLYADILVIRHPLEGAARVAAHATAKPVVNAGDGANQHPTQALIDLYAILDCQGKIDGLHIAIAGDLLCSRAVRSLCLALSHYAIRLYFISPPELPLPESIQCELRKKGVRFSFHASLEEVLFKADILYMTRIQKERLPPMAEPIRNTCCLKRHHLEAVKENFRILHPLPRVDEVELSIDHTPYAFYFQQAEHAACVRTAVLASLLRRL